MNKILNNQKSKSEENNLENILNKTDNLLNELNILSDSTAAVGIYGLMNYGTKIDEFNKDVLEFKESLNNKEKIEIQDYITPKIESRIQSIKTGGLIGYLSGVAAPLLEAFNITNYSLSNQEEFYAMVGGAVIGGVLGAIASKELPCSVQYSFNNYLNSDEKYLKIGNFNEFKH